MNLQTIKILLVDDDEDYYVITRTLLNESVDVKFELEWVSTYEEALVAIKQNKHDIYLFDYRIGAQTGLDILAEAINNKCTAPIILLTGQGDRETDIKAMKMGAADYLIKGKIDGALLERAIRFAIEQRRAEDFLRKSTKEWQTIFDTITNGVALLDAEGTVQRCNLAMVKIVGKPLNEIEGKKCWEALLDRDSLQDCLFLKTKVTNKRESQEVVTERGRFQIFVDPIRDERGSIIGGVEIITDITEQRKLEEQLLQAQRLESIGRLAGGIAHDFNNLMTAVLGYSSLILSGLSETDILRDDIAEIHKAGKRATLLTQQLLAFGRKQMLKVQVTDLNTIVSEMEKMLSRTLGENISLFIELEPKIKNIKVDPAQIEQVVMNLVINARDAIENSGRIYLRTENVNVSDKENNLIPNSRPGKFSLLTVKDTGTGIDKKYIEHIFEPFFTTKEKGKGTGLGLATAYGVVAQHGGWINVESESGRGSTFKVYLPICDEPSQMYDEEEPNIFGEHRGNGERILLVEDEDGVRRFVCRVLKENGYNVYAAANAEEARTIFTQEKGDFNLVFSDVVLPGMDGLQLAEGLLLLKPDLPVILASGYTDERSRLAEVQKKGLKFLSKPYPVSVLLRAIKESLAPKEK